MSAASESTPATEVPLGRPPRTQQTVGDMLRTMLVVGGFVLFLVVMVWRPWNHAHVQTVDWRPAAAVAASAKVVPVLGPKVQAAGWQATSARLDIVDGGRAWHLGFVTPSMAYAAVGVSNAPVSSYVSGILPGAVPSGSVTINGVKWTTYETVGAPDHGLVRTDKGGITYAVYGTANYQELTALLRSLVPIAPGQ